MQLLLIPEVLCIKEVYTDFPEEDERIEIVGSNYYLSFTFCFVYRRLQY